MKRRRTRPSSVQPTAALGLLLSVGLLLLPSSASALVSHTFVGTFGSAEQPSFTEAQGLAVDQSSGDLLVIDGEANTISRYNPDGTPAEFSALGSNVIDQGGLSFGAAAEVQVAVDNSGGATDGNIYVPQTGAKLVDIFGKDGSFLGQLTESKEGPFAEPCGIAVDHSGNVYLGDFSGHIHKFTPATNPPVNADSSANLAFESQCTLAAGAGATAGSIFPVSFFSGLVSKLDSTTGEENYIVAPGGNTKVTVDPASGHLYTAAGSEVKEYDASGALAATLLSGISLSEQVSDLAVSAATGDIYVAHTGNPHIEVWGPAVLLPDATTETASVVNASVTLHGAVNAAAGPPATCVFEYVEIHAKGFEGAASVPCSPAGPFTGTSGVSVSAEINGLPEAAYRFRLVASSENGPNAAKTLLFNTFERTPGLPDGRAYEMISPPQKAGEILPPEPNGNLSGSCHECLPGANNAMMPMQSAPDGEAVLYDGQPFAGGLAAGPNEYLSNRASSGWGSQSLSSPLFAPAGYRAFSSDLSRGVLHQVEPALSPEAPTREGKSFANLYLRGEGGSLQPLVTAEPPNREPGDFPSSFQIVYAGANAGTASAPAFDHLVFEANDALTQEVPGVAPKAPEVEAGERNLYEWADGQLGLINVLPGNTTAASNAVIGSGRLLVEHPTYEAPDVDHAISADGSRIFWSEESTGQVYARINGEQTLEVPGPGLCKESLPPEERVCFLTASADGSEVLLSDGQIYKLNVEAEAYEPSADLTEGQGGFRGILGASEDLSRVYFVDTEALTQESETNANGEHAQPGKLNLYASHEGTPTFIGTLLEHDNFFGSNERYGDWKASRPNRTAQVSPDGSYLAFMSQASLTGYDNTFSGPGQCSLNQGSGTSCFEVFEYAAGSGSLSCASCNPTGQQPIGTSNLSAIKGNPGFAPFPQPGNLSADGGGRLFFESQDALSPGDTNGHIQDVYEWEPGGLGSCKRADGCVFLISSGHSPNDSMFLTSTPSGNDAFFITRQQFLPRDKNEQLDLYDARAPHTLGEVVGFPEAGISPCGGEACKGPIASPPASPSAGSSEFSGPGNPPAPCKKGFVRKHGKCVRKHHKHHKRHHRRADSNRRASR